MYSTILISKNSRTGKLVGTHQKLDRAARRVLPKITPVPINFPTSRQIVYFEGARGPDGLKRKSPGVDEPLHFILPNSDDYTLIDIALDHQYNLTAALKNDDIIRASFEAAWLAHAITDGLTPAHHFPLSDAKEELMTEKEFIKIFGQPIKGIMHGKSPLETARNNWLYWGANGYMNKHVAFEYGVAVTTAAMSYKSLYPNFTDAELQNLDLKHQFLESLNKIYRLDMYHRFLKKGWTTELAVEVKQILLPEIVKNIALAWTEAIKNYQKET
ncbi:hypothetical protein IKF33_03130 [Candidatus Saccharibacteria bacterium]|nr:hypothetical protein [Candidatus Saccharibacteria bacterium]